MRRVEAKMLFESGAVDGAHILRAKDGSGWILKLVINRDVNFDLELQSERGPVRIFKSIEAVIKTAEDIGLSEVKVIV